MTDYSAMLRVLSSCSVCDKVAPVVKNPPANAGDLRDIGLIPGSRRFPWRRAWQPTLVFFPEESHGQRRVTRGGSMGSQRVRHDWSDLAWPYVIKFDWLSSSLCDWFSDQFDTYNRRFFQKHFLLQEWAGKKRHQVAFSLFVNHTRKTSTVICQHSQIFSCIQCAPSVNNQNYLCLLTCLGLWFRARVQSITEKWPFPENPET